jgi:hypothetical protein
MFANPFDFPCCSEATSPIGQAYLTEQPFILASTKKCPGQFLGLFFRLVTSTTAPTESPSGISVLLGLQMQILQALKKETTKLEQQLTRVRAAITALNGASTGRAGHKYVRSAAARRKMSLAQPKRWATRRGK